MSNQISVKEMKEMLSSFEDDQMIRCSLYLEQGRGGSGDSDCEFSFDVDDEDESNLVLSVSGDESSDSGWYE